MLRLCTKRTGFEKHRGKVPSTRIGERERARARRAYDDARGRQVHATKRRPVDRTHVLSDENLHATSCGLFLSIKSSVTILSRYPRRVEAAPIMVAMMVVRSEGRTDV